MADRFERLYSLPNNLYTEGSPVIISAGALLKDNTTGSIIVQIKFHSISENIIKAVKISITGYDVLGKEVDGVQDYQYLDLTIKNGQEFGSNKAIVLPNSITRSFAIKNITVIFSGNTQWNCESINEFITLPIPKKLSIETHDSEILKQYRLETTEKAHYIPQELNDLWCCSCGEWNSLDRCTNCQQKKESIFSAYNLSNLEKAMFNRLEKERQEQEKEKQYLDNLKRLQKEEYEQNQKRKKAVAKKIKTTRSLISIVIILISTIAFYIYPYIIKPNTDYKIANNLYEQEDYITAAIAFEKLGNFKDSEYFAQKIWYDTGLRSSISTGYFHTIGLKNDGSVIATGSNYNGQCDVNSWQDIVSLAAGGYHSVGLKADGTVVAIGRNDFGECDVDHWSNIISIAAGENFTVGLKADGTITFAGEYAYSKNDSFTNMENLISISATASSFYGITSNGSVIYPNGSILISDDNEIKKFSGSTGGYRSYIAIKKDGSVVAYGENLLNNEYNFDTTKFDQIKIVAAGNDFVVGVTVDGDVLIEGDNENIAKAKTWNNVVFLHAQGINKGHIVAVKSDGTVVATGTNDSGQCNVGAWKDIRVPT